MTRVALDTNILAYLAGVSRSAADEAKIGQVRNVIACLGETVSLIAPTQTLGELFVVLKRSGASAEEARAILLEFGEAFGTAASETRTVLAAADLVVDHKLQFWDSLIVNGRSRCGLHPAALRGHAEWLRDPGPDHRRSAAIRSAPTAGELAGRAPLKRLHGG